MTALDELVHEHDAVRLTLKILERLTRELERNGKMAHPDHLGSLIEFFSVFVDKCHHGKEEEYLFPSMEEVGVARSGGPIAVMLHEHQQGREIVTRMNAGLARYRQGDPEAAAVLAAAAREYITLLDQHIEKENQVLFPMAAQKLSTAKLEQLAAGFDQIEKEKIGEGRHEEFHRLLDSLKSIYLG